MERTDFFTAPASTRFHLNEAGGLVRHSLNVTGLLMQHQDENPESLAICGCFTTCARRIIIKRRCEM
jgi:hypothetical protein